MDNNYINLEEGVARVAGQKAIYLKMLGMFLQAGEFQRFDDEMSAGDTAAAAGTAHAIKGLTGNLSLTKLFEASQNISDKLKVGDVPSQSELDEYHQILDDTKAAVNELISEG